MSKKITRISFKEALEVFRTYQSNQMDKCVNYSFTFNSNKDLMKLIMLKFNSTVVNINGVQCSLSVEGIGWNQRCNIKRVA